jgi:hypothetical protein
MCKHRNMKHVTSLRHSLIACPIEDSDQRDLFGARHVSFYVLSVLKMKDVSLSCIGTLTFRLSKSITIRSPLCCSTQSMNILYAQSMLVNKVRPPMRLHRNEGYEIGFAKMVNLKAHKLYASGQLGDTNRAMTARCPTTSRRWER